MSEKRREYGKNMRVSVHELDVYKLCIDNGLYEPHDDLRWANIAVCLLQQAVMREESKAYIAEQDLRYEKERADKAEAELLAIRRILDGVPTSDVPQCREH